MEKEKTLVKENGIIVEKDINLVEAELEMNRMQQKLWVDNYENNTDVAKWAMSFVAETFNGRGEYIPWSAMIAVLKKLDFSASVEVLESEDGGYVFTQRIPKPTKVFTHDTTTEIDGKDGEVTKSVIVEKDILTEAQIHFVRVKVVYLGQVHIEEYPILDNSHQPTDNLNSAIVNKNIQRAKARAISTVTGVGFSLWTREESALENTLIEEPKEQVKKPKAKKVESKEIKKAEIPKKDKEEKVMSLNDELTIDGKPLELHEEVARFVFNNKDNETVMGKLKDMTPVINSQSGMDLSEAIDDENKLSALFEKVGRLDGLYTVLKGE